MVQGYCVKCNRGKPKGSWNKVEILNNATRRIVTSRGIKGQVVGTCPDCGSKITKMIKVSEVDQGGTADGDCDRNPGFSVKTGNR